VTECNELLALLGRYNSDIWPLLVVATGEGQEPGQSLPVRRDGHRPMRPIAAGAGEVGRGPGRSRPG
jgi:hypothetical protein